MYVARLESVVGMMPPVASNSKHRALVRASMAEFQRADRELDDMILRLSKRLETPKPQGAKKG